MTFAKRQGIACLLLAGAANAVRFMASELTVARSRLAGICRP
jgi:hypothetical protein